MPRREILRRQGKGRRGARQPSPGQESPADQPQAEFDRRFHEFFDRSVEAERRAGEQAVEGLVFPPHMSAADADRPFSGPEPPLPTVVPPDGGDQGPELVVTAPHAGDLVDGNTERPAPADVDLRDRADPPSLTVVPSPEAPAYVRLVEDEGGEGDDEVEDDDLVLVDAEDELEEEEEEGVDVVDEEYEDDAVAIELPDDDEEYVVVDVDAGPVSLDHLGTLVTELAAISGATQDDVDDLATSALAVGNQAAQIAEALRQARRDAKAWRQEARDLRASAEADAEAIRQTAREDAESLIRATQQEARSMVQAAQEEVGGVLHAARLASDEAAEKLRAAELARARAQRAARELIKKAEWRAAEILTDARTVHQELGAAQRELRNRLRGVEDAFRALPAVPSGEAESG